MLSIILPAFNEEENISFIYNEITAVRGLPDDLEIIFVDDGSGDQTFQRVRELAVSDSRVRGIRLSRNFGHQVALLAGMKEAAGDRVLTMDVDGQHPPQLIPALLKKQEEGYEIVNTRRMDGKDTGPFKRISSKWFYRIINAMSDTTIETSSADFRLMTRKAVDAFLELDEHDRFNRGLIGWLGFDQTVVEFLPGKRNKGKSKYSLKRMRRFALDGITSFSSRPLRMSMFLGLFILILAVIYIVYAIVMHFTGHTNPGWTSLLITVLFLGSVQLISIGILGEYLGRVFNEVKGRPHYFIAERTEGNNRDI